MKLNEKQRKGLAREYFESILVAVIIALIVRTFIVSAYRIPTGSMAPTLKIGDFVFAYRLPFGITIPLTHHKFGMRAPERGQVVVFRYPGNESVSYVKRVVGLPGDRILIRNKKLFINGKPADYQPLASDLIADQPGHEYYNVLRESFDGKARTVMMANTDEASFFGPEVVPPGKVFVLGDNRDSSDDSRYWGVVPLENIQGRVFMVWLSLDWLNSYPEGKIPRIRWDRVFSRIH
jgi:signal peptidase I